MADPLSSAVISTALILIFSLHIAESADYQICSPPTKQHGLVPPILPLNLVAYYETTQNTSNLVSSTNLYIDADNDRVALIKRSPHKHEFRLLYDYGMDRVIKIGRSGLVYDLEAERHINWCEVTKLKNDAMGSSMGESLATILTTFLSYTRRLSWVERAMQREMAVDHYNGCINTKHNNIWESYKIDYYFAAKSTLTPSSYMRAPISVKEQGIVTNMQNLTKHRAITQIKSFFYFDTLKVKYDEVFEVPEGVYCSGYQKIKPLPTLQKDFVTGVEVLHVSNGYVMGSFLRVQTLNYHKEYLSQTLLMERVDFTSSGDWAILQSKYINEELSVIHDLTSDASFVIERQSGACTFYAHNLLNETKLQKYKYADNVIFNDKSDTNYIYKGVESCGDEKCDVWVTDQTTTFKTFTGKATTWTEIRFLANGWKDRYDKGNGLNWPIEAVTYINTSAIKGVADESGGMESYRIRLYDYASRAPDLADYDVSACLIDSNRKYKSFELAVPKNLLSFTQDNKIEIRTKVAQAFAILGFVPVTRIQDVHVYFNDQKQNAMVTFSVTSPYKTDMPLLQIPISVVLAEIEDEINSGFSIQLTGSITGEETGPVTLKAVPKSLKPLFPKSNYQADDSVVVSGNDTIMIKQQDTVTTTKSGPRYSGGVLAAVIIVMMILGMALGSLGMVLFFKKINSHPDDLQRSFAMEDLIPASHQ